jgi:RHH-type rel operon transcriptional repressor/antitoxin RelB
MRTVSVRLEDELNDRLEALAAKTARTKTYYMAEALNRYLDDLEDVYLAERTLEALRAGKERTYTLEEAEKRLGLAG